jgi:hypothetical protein
MFFILIPQDDTLFQRNFYTDRLKISLNDAPIPNRRTKFDRTNLTCLRGDDEFYEFHAWIGKEKANLSNRELRVTGRVTERNDTELFSFDIEDGVNGSDFQNGIFVMFLSKEITIDLPTLLKYDIKCTNSSGDVFTLVSGQIEVRTEYLTNKNTIP